MIGGLINLVSYGIGTGGSVGDILFRLESMGFFAYVLPFLLIFALVYGILSKTNIFNNNGINIILSLAVSLMALQFNFVSYFFAELFPRMGIVLSMILVLFILVGAFIDFENHPKIKYVFGALAFIAVIVIVLQSFGDFVFFSGFGFGSFGFFLEEWGPTLLVIILLVAGIALPIMKSGNKNNNNNDSNNKNQRH
jgi:hypothetical protein